MRNCRRFYDCWGRSTRNTIHDGGHAECAITLITGDSRIKSLVDGGGAIILLLSLYAMMPSMEWGTPVNEAAHNLLNHFEAAIPALVSYMIGDACGSAGSALVS